MQSETAIQTLKLLGASPIAMSRAEVYTSLQQGILDGAENNEFALTIARHGEVARYYTYDMHTRIPDILLMSTLTLEKLTPEQQRIVEAAIKASIEFEKAAWDKEIEKTGLAAVKISTLNSTRSTKTLPGGSTAYLRRSEKQTAALRAVSTYPDSKN